MRNSLGTNVVLTLFGESHSDVIGAVLDGFASGIAVDIDYIKGQLLKRRPQGSYETARVENDDFKIVSGLFEGYTTGDPICVIMGNNNVKSDDYIKNRSLARPSHVDFVSHVAHSGYEDYRGSGHFSGRLTAPIVAIGSICRKALEDKGIYIGTHILSCGKAKDRQFSGNLSILDVEIGAVNSKIFPVIDDVEKDMENEIEAVRKDGDSIGGVIQTAVTHLPVGIGDPWFCSVEGALSNAMFSIGGIKGIEFGLGFGFANVTAKECNDELYNDNGVVRTYTNNNGGINGGLTNGMPVVFNCCVKPTPSISVLQRTVDIDTNEDAIICVEGRHDPAIIRRVCAVVNSMTSIVVCDLLKTRFSNVFFSNNR